ncbi:hypothetical protein ELQ88_18300 [Pseudomonas sp. MPC6]|nr:hypothetical protein ELQ88_18300 [Pseudomonas sp. MPC6]
MRAAFGPPFFSLKFTQDPVGASLLAMAADQSTLILNLRASSRASSLPQVFHCPDQCHFNPHPRALNEAFMTKVR